MSVLDAYMDLPPEEPGTAIEIHVNGETVITDIRQVSGERIGPRMSFAGWFRAVRAQEGATLRLTRLGERRFQLEYLGRNAGNPGRNP